MTNKINGIDVSECPLFDKKTGCYHTFNGECAKDSCAVYKWLLEYKRLQEENEQLKKPFLVMPKVNQLAVPIEKYEKLYKALEEIREIIEFRFKTAYMTLGLKETDKIIEEIEKIASEVLNDRD